MKKWTAVLLVMLLVLAACSSPNNSTGNNGTSNSGTSNSGTSNNGNSGNNASQQEPVVLNMVTHSDWEAPLVKALAKYKEINSHVTVNVQYNPYPKMVETNEILLGAKSKDIDVVTVDSPLTSNYAIKGYLEPLDAWFSGDVLSKWTEPGIESGTFNDELYSIPMNSSSVMLFYNKDMLEAAQVPFPDESPEQRMTWDELVDMSKKLTNGDVYGFSFDQVGRAYQILAMVNGKGGQALSDDGLVSKGFTNSPESVEAMQYYYDFFNTWKISPKILRAETLDYFITGKVAIFLSNTAILPRLESSGMNYGIAPHPYFADGVAVTPTGSLNLGVSKFSDKKDAAAELIQFLTYGEGAQILFDESGQLPANVELLEQINTDAKFEELPFKALRLAAYESMETAVSRPITPGYLEWESNFNKAAEDIKNGANPKQTLDELVDVIDRQLAKYGAAQ